MATENTTAKATGKQKTVSIVRTLNLPLNTVWRAWSEPVSFKKWWGPNDFTCPQCSIDFKVGGKILACMKSKEGQEIWSTCIFIQIEPMKKIVYDDNFADEKGNKVTAAYYDMPGDWGKMIVTLNFEEIGDKTKMTLNHEGIPEEVYEDCIQGWQESIDKLERNVN